MFNLKIMKMGAGIFWGIILILIGLGIVIKVVFNIDFPVFRFLVAFFFILIGIKILFGNYGPKHCHFKDHGNDIIFNEKHVNGNPDEKDYNVIFGKGVFDFRDVDLSEGTVDLKVSSVFGGTEIIINADTPLKIKSDCVFSGVELPDGSSAVFGSAKHTSDNFSENNAYLNIKIEAVFSGVKVIRR